MASQTSALPYAARGEANPAVASSLAILVIAAATIAGAWFFQLVLEILPCPMCLEQRYAYYFTIPFAVLVALAAAKGAPRTLACAFVRKPSALGEPIDAVGWDAPDVFLVGYGMDDAGRYRGLPFIAALET